MTIPITISNGRPFNRGRESHRHLAGKLALGILLIYLGFFVLYEHRLSDLVGFRRSRNRLWRICAEHDTTNRNTSTNISRNFANGCHANLILVPDEAARVAVRRLLRRRFPRDHQVRVGVITYKSILARLERLPDGSISPHDRQFIFSHLTPSPQIQSL